jgi:hypothetical protein
VEQNYTEALKWLIISGEYGHVDQAVEYARKLKARASDEQIKEATRLAQEWLSTQ